MATLKELHCQACRSDAPVVTPEEIRALMPELPDWAIVRSPEEIPQLQRVFEFPDFSSALAFTNRVGEVAEAESHHPAILTEWGRVTVRWWTHKIRGLHKNDFVMAAKTDALLQPATR